MLALALGCVSEQPTPTADDSVPATIAAGVATRIATQIPTLLPTVTPRLTMAVTLTPTPAPRAMPVPGLGDGSHPIVVLGPDRLQDAGFRRSQRYILVGCYYEEEITGPRGPNADRELRFSYKSRADTDDTVTVDWGSSSERGLPERGCYELATTYTGPKKYVRTTRFNIPGTGSGGIEMHSFKMLDHAGISSDKWNEYRSAPPTPTPEPTATPSPTATPDPTATPTITPTPEPTATPPPTLTPTPTPTPTLTPTPSPTPTATPRPTSTPTPTPVPPPTPVPTGEWMTWPQIQALELEGDKDGEPRILLQGETPRSSTSIVLNVDCQNIDGSRQIEVYMQERSAFPTPTLPFTKTSDEIPVQRGRQE